MSSEQAPYHTCHSTTKSLRGQLAQDNDLDLTIKDGHARSLQTHYDHDLAIKDRHTWP